MTEQPCRWRCHMCSKDFSSRKALLAHGRKTHPGSKVACRLCAKFTFGAGWDVYKQNWWLPKECDLEDRKVWREVSAYPYWECFCELDDEAIAAASKKIRADVRRYFSGAAKKLKEFL